MKRSEIYREAARWVNDGWHCACCEALDATDAMWSEIASAKHFFAQHYQPTGKSLYWFGPCCCDEPESRPIRTLALCFMAAIAEAEEAATKVTRAKKKRRPLAHAKRVPAVSK